MPLTLSVGLSRKVGEANYGSRGANVNFTVELESSLIREPDQLREKVRYLFHLAKEAVEEELANESKPDSTHENGHATSSDGNGNGFVHLPNGRPATSSQGTCDPCDCRAPEHRPAFSTQRTVWRHPARRSLDQ